LTTRLNFFRHSRSSHPQGGLARPLHGYAFFCGSGRSPAMHFLSNRVRSIRLFRLVRQGLLKANWGTSENNRRAKFYELTVAGRKRLREETASWNRLATAIGSRLPATEEV